MDAATISGVVATKVEAKNGDVILVSLEDEAFLLEHGFIDELATQLKEAFRRAGHDDVGVLVLVGAHPTVQIARLEEPEGKP